MSTGTIIVLVLLAISILIGIIAPFFSKKSNPQLQIEVSEGLDLGREEIFSSLSDLEYDYQMEKISENDYQLLKAELMEKAAATMSGVYLDRERIEREVDREIDQYLSGKVSRKERANEI